MHLGELLARSGRTEEAIVQLKLAVEIFPNVATLRNNLATALFSNDQLRDAVLHYRAAVRLDPGYFNSWFNMGRALGSLGRLGEAREALAQARGLRPGSPDVAAAMAALGGD